MPDSIVDKHGGNLIGELGLLPDSSDFGISELLGQDLLVRDQLCHLAHSPSRLCAVAIARSNPRLSTWASGEIATMMKVLSLRLYKARQGLRPPRGRSSRSPPPALTAL